MPGDPCSSLQSMAGRRTKRRCTALNAYHSRKSTKREAVAPTACISPSSGTRRSRPHGYHRSGTAADGQWHRFDAARITATTVGCAAEDDQWMFTLRHTRPRHYRAAQVTMASARSIFQYPVLVPAATVTPWSQITNSASDVPPVRRNVRTFSLAQDAAQTNPILVQSLHVPVTPRREDYNRQRRVFPAKKR